MAAVRDVSDSLDVISQIPGTTLVRGAELWEPVQYVPGNFELSYLTRDAGQSSGAGYSLQTIQWTDVVIDQSGAFDPGTPDQLEVQSDGLYACICQGRQQTGGGGMRAVTVQVNGDNLGVTAGAKNSGNIPWFGNAVWIWAATAGDIVKMGVQSADSSQSFINSKIILVRLA